MWLVADGFELNASVNTGCDYSAISCAMVRKLKNVVTQWMGPQMRTAGGHLIIPFGECRARLEIRGFTCVSDFIILPECSRGLILGMDCLQVNAAIINLHRSNVSFSTEQALPVEELEERRYSNECCRG